LSNRKFYLLIFSYLEIRKFNYSHSALGVARQRVSLQNSLSVRIGFGGRYRHFKGEN